MNIDIGSWNSLHLSLWSVTEVRSQIDGEILFSNFEVGDRGEHGGVVVIEL
mgnify:CR=1 FL=1